MQGKREAGVGALWKPKAGTLTWAEGWNISWKTECLTETRRMVKKKPKGEQSWGGVGNAWPSKLFSSELAAWSLSPMGLWTGSNQSSQLSLQA